jgi:hypothetical protein
MSHGVIVHGLLAHCLLFNLQVVLSFLEKYAADAVMNPLALVQAISDIVGGAIVLMNNVLAINALGAQHFQPPKEFPETMPEGSIVLRSILSAAKHRMHPSRALLLPPSDDDWSHLMEWRDTADYAATTLAMVAGIVDMDTGFKSPLLGESNFGRPPAVLVSVSHLVRSRCFCNWSLWCRIHLSLIPPVLGHCLHAFRGGPWPDP